MYKNLLSLLSASFHLGLVGVWALISECNQNLALHFQHRSNPAAMAGWGSSSSDWWQTEEPAKGRNRGYYNDDPFNVWGQAEEPAAKGRNYNDGHDASGDEEGYTSYWGASKGQEAYNGDTSSWEQHAYNEGYSHGHRRGYNDGYDAGVDEGYQSAKKDALDGNDNVDGGDYGDGDNPATAKKAEEKSNRTGNSDNDNVEGGGASPGAKAKKKRSTGNWKQWAQDNPREEGDGRYPDFQVFIGERAGWQSFYQHWQEELRARWYKSRAGCHSPLASHLHDQGFDVSFEDGGWNYRVFIVGKDEERPQMCLAHEHCVGYQVNLTVSPDKMRPVRINPFLPPSVIP